MTTKQQPTTTIEYVIKQLPGKQFVQGYSVNGGKVIPFIDLPYVARDLKPSQRLALAQQARKNPVYVACAFVQNMGI